MTDPTVREHQLEQMLADARMQIDYLVAGRDRIEGLSRLLRHKNSSFAGSHVADLIDNALAGA